jgi:hypothetical protein
MPWLIALVLMVGALCFAGFVVRIQAQEGAGALTAEKVAKASSAEIERMLGDLEVRPAPEAKLGAMCYAPMRPSPVTEYVCPVCGEKTLYAPDERERETPVNGLEFMRRAELATQQAARKKGASVRLDEKQFCRHCLPAFEGVPRAALVVRLPNGSETRTEDFKALDLWMLRDFFDGKRVLTGGNDSETPLKDQVPRLRELLGLEKVEE